MLNATLGVSFLKRLDKLDGVQKEYIKSTRVNEIIKEYRDDFITYDLKLKVN